jgi:hypothetical protein
MAQAHTTGHDERARPFRRASLLGYHLSQSHGFRVVQSDGTELGILENLRYEGHADYPDEIVVRQGRLVRRRRLTVPFSWVESVNPRARVVTVRRPG